MKVNKASFVLKKMKKEKTKKEKDVIQYQIN